MDLQKHAPLGYPWTLVTYLHAYDVLSLGLTLATAAYSIVTAAETTTQKQLQHERYIDAAQPLASLPWEAYHIRQAGVAYSCTMYAYAFTFSPAQSAGAGVCWRVFRQHFSYYYFIVNEFKLHWIELNYIEFIDIKLFLLYCIYYIYRFIFSYLYMNAPSVELHLTLLAHVFSLFLCNKHITLN